MRTTTVQFTVPFGKEGPLVAVGAAAGATLTGITEAPIVAKGLSGARLLRHLRINGCEPGLDEDFQDHLGTSYEKIFDYLRVLPIDRQAELLGSFLGGAMRVSGVGARLGTFMARANNIDWLVPTETPQHDELQRLSDGFYDQMGMPNLPLEIVDRWSTLGELIVANFKQGQLVTYDSRRHEWLTGLDQAARQTLGDHRDYREAFEAWRMVNGIFADMGRASVFRGRFTQLLHWAGEGFSKKDFAKMGVAESITNDAALVATSIVLDRHAVNLGYSKGLPAEAFFDGIYGKGFAFLGPIGGKSVVLALNPQEILRS